MTIPVPGPDVRGEADGKVPDAGVALTRTDLVQVFLRSFMFQSLWSYQRMQNVGWLFSLWPVFRRLHPDQEERARVAQDHAGYFNTHPYTADIILGVVASLEEKRAQGNPVDREAILAARKSMSGPLSAVGETVFWATLAPLILIGSVVLGLVFRRGSWWITLLSYLIVFNLLHVVVKGGGLLVGYRRGLDVAAFLVQWPVQRWVGRGAWLGMGLCLGVLAVAVARAWHPAAGTAAAVVVVFFLRRGGSPLFLPLLAAAAGFFAFH